MKKSFNIIQINGTRGLILVAGIVCCLFVGFVIFPGWVAMHLWNFTAGYFEQMPVIGVIQGILLWGIAAVSYFTFRKDKLVVCMRASDGLSDEELKSVFSNIRRQAQEDSIIRNMIKAREAELKLKALNDLSAITKPENSTIKSDEQSSKVETK